MANILIYLPLSFIIIDKKSIHYTIRKIVLLQNPKY